MKVRRRTRERARRKAGRHKAALVQIRKEASGRGASLKVARKETRREAPRKENRREALLREARREAPRKEAWGRGASLKAVRRETAGRKALP